MQMLSCARVLLCQHRHGKGLGLVTAASSTALALGGTPACSPLPPATPSTWRASKELSPMAMQVGRGSMSHILAALPKLPIPGALLAT